MKRNISLIIVPGVLGLLLTGLLLWGLSPHVERSQAAAPAAPQQAAFWEEDFSQAISPSTYYTTATEGSGLVDSGSFLLTQDASYQRGRIFYLTPTLMDEFSTSFSLYLGSNDYGGSDGAAFIFCPSYNYTPDTGGTLDASCPGGYIVAFDTYDIYNDTVYIAFNDYANRLHTVGVPNLANSQWHDAKVIFDQGTLTLTLDGSNVIAGFAIPDYEPFMGYFGFSAATGEWHNEQRVDNIYIGPFGQLDGHVYDAETLEPIAYATVSAERQGGVTWSTVTDPSGYYSMEVHTGTYTVTAENPYYLTNVATELEVIADAVTTQDFYLVQKVTFEPTPLHVTLDWQTTDSMNATLENRQPWEYDFEFHEQFGSFLPAEQGEEIDSVSTSSPESDTEICADALCEEIYGNTTNTVNDSQMDIGNIFEASEDTLIREIRAWMNFSAPTDMYFFVYEGEALLGSFNKIFEVQVMTDIGAQWHSSGPIVVPAQAGKYYYVGASYNGTASFYYGGAIPIETDCFGTLHTGAAYQALYPPAATINNSYTSGGVSPLHFAIVTGEVDIPWFGQEPLTGTVPASNAEPGELSASMLFSATYAAGVYQPGDYYTTLLVGGDPTLQVPVTMTVLPPFDMGKVVGSVTDNCTAEPIAGVQVIIVYGDPITKTWTDEAGNYTAWLYPGSYELTFSADGYLSITEKVDIFAGQETTLDVSLVPERACIDVYPDKLEAWVLTNTLVYTHPYGLDFINDGGQALNFKILEGGELIEAHGGFTSASSQRTEEGSIFWNYRNEEGIEVEMSDSGTMVAYPGSYQYAPDVPTTQANILVYTDDWVHPTPNTLVQQAIARLGVPATVYVDNDYAGFETALTTGGPWDLVIWSGENYYVSSTLMPKLLAYVQAGGKLAATYWRQLDFPSDPLWNEMGFQYISNYITPPPAYWWEPSHLIFNFPESAPEWLNRVANSTNSNGTKLEPLASGLAVAGYTTTSMPDEAGMVIRDDGFTVYKGIRDVSTNADDDSDGVLDGVELWENIITGLLEGFLYIEDIPWLWEDPITGTVPALTTFNVDILFSSVLTNPLPLGTYTANLFVVENDPLAPLPYIPVSMHVVEAFIDPVPSFESNAPLCLGETAVFTNTSTEGVPTTEYYQWDFGDGETMTTETTVTVTHDYSAGGSYTVSLTAHQKQTGMEFVYTDTIEVKPLPLADFSYTAAGVAVSFSNISANATSYAWDFGDGATSTLENPTHTYAVPGDYLVSLTAYGECGLDQIEKTVSAGYHKNYLPLVYR